jgi:hypothetical protein
MEGSGGADADGKGADASAGGWDFFVMPLLPAAMA